MHYLLVWLKHLKRRTSLGIKGLQLVVSQQAPSFSHCDSLSMSSAGLDLEELVDIGYKL